MKKQVWMIALLAMGITAGSFAGETSLAAFGTYFDGSENGGYDGVGGGVKLRKKFLGFFSADIRASYLDFSDLDTSVIPVEATLMVGIPFFIEPYAGLGASYFFFDTDQSGIDDGAGLYGVLGLQLNLWIVGAFAELRYNETETELMDGMSGNLGLMVKW